MHPEEAPWVGDLRREVRYRLWEQRASQVMLADYLKISTKHLNQVLQGDATGNTELLGRLAAAVGLRIILADTGQMPVMPGKRFRTRNNRLRPERGRVHDPFDTDWYRLASPYAYGHRG